MNQVQYSTAISSTNLAKNLEAAINGVSSQCGTTSCINASQTANSLATATESIKHRNVNRKDRRLCRQLQCDHGPVTTSTKMPCSLSSMTNTTPGQGPNYVSGITITSRWLRLWAGDSDHTRRRRQRRSRGSQHQPFKEQHPPRISRHGAQHRAGIWQPVSALPTQTTW